MCAVARDPIGKLNGAAVEAMADPVVRSRRRVRFTSIATERITPFLRPGHKVHHSNAVIPEPKHSGQVTSMRWLLSGDAVVTTRGSPFSSSRFFADTVPRPAARTGLRSRPRRPAGRPRDRNELIKRWDQPWLIQAVLRQRGTRVGAWADKFSDAAGGVGWYHP
jgi:hypothetical protein